VPQIIYRTPGTFFFDAYILTHTSSDRHEPRNLILTNQKTQNSEGTARPGTGIVTARNAENCAQSTDNTSGDFAL
jgi:hypothetical protein